MDEEMSIALAPGANELIVRVYSGGLHMIGTDLDSDIR